MNSEQGIASVSLKATDRVVGRAIADEFVIVPLAGQMSELNAVYVLNPVARSIWEKLQKHVSRFSNIVDALLEEYDVDRATLERDVTSFLHELIDTGLVKQEA